MDRFDVLIVGAGHGGAQAAIALRQYGFDGTIGLIGDESRLPYERPPLSKDYLAGTRAFERMLIRPPAFWEERKVMFRLGSPLVRIDPDRHEAELASGEPLSYGKMIWAAGGSPRRLDCPGQQLRGVHAIRSIDDVDGMALQLPHVRDVVIVGGGYIGLEAAAVLSGLGKTVVILEALDRVLARVAGEPLSRFYEAQHRAHGVEIRTGIKLESIEEEDGRASAVRLATSERLNADMVIVGIGIVPTVEPLIRAGAAGSSGVDVDEFCRTSLSDIFAIGDCAAHENKYAGGARVRLESVQNATDQAIVAAKSISGIAEPYSAVPWFWSNQYDLKLQTVGLALGHDELVVRGSPRERSFSIVYLKAGRVIALDCVNSVKDYVQGRALVQQRVEASKERLADTDVPLKALAL